MVKAVHGSIVYNSEKLKTMSIDWLNKYHTVWLLKTMI